MQTARAMFVSIGCALAVACADNLEVPETNVTPVAVARLLGDESLMPSVSFPGTPLMLTLDGSQSRDSDGSIGDYRWLSATQATDLVAGSADATSGAGAEQQDAGVVGLERGRWVPEGELADWPEDVEQPTVRLAAPGNYSFVLWVTDKRGRVSDPTYLTIQVVGAAAP